PAAEAKPSLEELVDDFVNRLEERFPARFKRRPQALKDRVQSLINLKLRPYPRHSGRPLQGRITKAAKLYQDQRAEVRIGNRKAVDWDAIAHDCISGFTSIRSSYYRKAALERLQNAVYARRRRQRDMRRPKRRRSQGRIAIGSAMMNQEQ